MGPARLFFSMLALWAGSGCAPQAPLPADTRAAHQAIVVGDLSVAYPGVGALVTDEAQMGQHMLICSGSLIEPEWVLTSAHCVSELVGMGALILFCVGQDATSAAGCQLYASDFVYVHNAWQSGDPTHNLALMHLDTPVPAGVATPVVRNDLDLTGHENEALTMVGYGMSIEDDQNSAGLKRSAPTVLGAVAAETVTIPEGPAGQQYCGGDGGGAALMDLGSGAALVAVPSNYVCSGNATATRVDSHSTWLQEIMALGGNCDILGGLCGDRACIPVGPDDYACFASDGLGVNAACDSEQYSSLPCADGLICIDFPVAEGGEGEVCYEFCHERADCPAEHLCIVPIFEGFDDVGICLLSPDCDLTGGDCESGQACYPNGYGGWLCFPSDGLAPGQACDADASNWQSLPCADGSLCVQEGASPADGLCLAMCAQDTECGAGDFCDSPVFADLPDVGVCRCVDADADGWCSAEDCLDDDPASHPGAEETCDGRDNNCDQDTDEGCPACLQHADCDDGEICTEDLCSQDLGTCVNASIAGCCHAEDECDDGDSCTVDVCEESTNQCANDPVEGCCENSTDCDDANPCTTDICEAGTNTCQNLPVQSCCATSAACDDGDPCTTDVCSADDHSCSNVAIPDCCSAAAECDDDDPCTIDLCQDAVCAHVPDSACGADGGLPDGGDADAGDGGDLEQAPGGSGCGCGEFPDSRSAVPWLALGLVLILRRRHSAKGERA